MTATPMACAKWLLPVPGGAVTYCAVSAFRRHPLFLASPRRPTPDRQEHSAGARRSARLAVSAARWHVDLPARVDDSREQCVHLVLVDDPCVSVAALEALIGLLRALPPGAAPARIEAEAMSDDKEARHDATTAIRPGSTGAGVDRRHAVGGRARRHPRPRSRAVSPGPIDTPGLNDMVASSGA